MSGMAMSVNLSTRWLAIPAVGLAHAVLAFVVQCLVGVVGR